MIVLFLHDFVLIFWYMCAVFFIFRFSRVFIRFMFKD